jgi:peptidoglycan hydrolase-like protein with peptidoglycan-binding domain
MNKIIFIAATTVLLSACSWFGGTPAPAPTTEPVQVAVPMPPPAPLPPQETVAGANANAYVVELQTALNRHGAHLRVDGMCGPATRKAVAAYQTDLGVPLQDDKDCHVGDHTWSGLGLSAGH